MSVFAGNKMDKVQTFIPTDILKECYSHLFNAADDSGSIYGVLSRGLEVWVEGGTR